MEASTRRIVGARGGQARLVGCAGSEEMMRGILVESVLLHRGGREHIVPKVVDCGSCV